jgi:DNA repair protein RecN (Recombination protein N)
MLCIKALMAKYVGMPTMIFDEIDTGVSGSIADKMGELIGEMGENMQVFAITHLPQVASKGSAHYLVYKEFNDKNEAKSGIKQISGEERILEIARMLSGTKLSDAAIANAKVLLGGKN